MQQVQTATISVPNYDDAKFEVFSVKFSNHVVRSDLSTIPEGDGIYIFAGRNSEQEDWRLIYIGTASNIRKRLNNHEKISCWTRQGYPENAALILRTDKTEEERRLAYERALIDEYKPPCNLH